MGEQGTETSAHDLHQHVSKCLAPVQVTSDRHHQADRRIEVSTADWREDRDDHDENGAGRSVLQRSAIAVFPPASFAAMMPEPITAATNKAVPRASAIKRRAMSNYSMIPPGDLSA
jgi:hypothetical protein